MNIYIVLRIEDEINKTLKYLSGTSIIKYNTLSNINNANLVDYNNIPILSNSIYLFIKHINLINTNILEELKSKGNKLIFEPIDYNYQSNDYLNELNNIINYFDEIICVSHHFKNILSKLNNTVKYSVIYHEYDNNFKNGPITNNIYYIGNLKRKCSLTKKNIIDYSIKYISPKNNNFHNEYYNGIHINFLKQNHNYYDNITTTKLATCLYLNSIFICNKVPVYVEILGEDYNFYIKEDLSNLQYIIDLAKDTINDNSKYEMYINKYKKICDMFSPNNISNLYNNVLKKYYD